MGWPVSRRVPEGGGSVGTATYIMAFVTHGEHPQPLWQPPPTACLTTAGAASEVPSLPMPPLGGGGEVINMCASIPFLRVSSFRQVCPSMLQMQNLQHLGRMGVNLYIGKHEGRTRAGRRTMQMLRWPATPTRRSRGKLGRWWAFQKQSGAVGNTCIRVRIGKGERRGDPAHRMHTVFYLLYAIFRIFLGRDVVVYRVSRQQQKRPPLHLHYPT